MSKINEGDRVVISARPQTAADIKSQLYFPHYSNLAGTVLKLFGEEASILIERSSLPDSILARHEETEKSMRRRYLDGLSEEARSRSSEREKNFQLNYAVLVSVNDIKPAPASSGRATSDDLTAAEDAFLAERTKKN